MPFCHRHEGDPRGEDLGDAYNNYMELIPDADWVCFMDHDICQTTRSWFRLIEDAIEAKPSAGAFVPMVSRLNRSKSGWQMIPGCDIENDSMRHHWGVGNDRFREHRGRLRDVTDVEFEDDNNGYKPFSGCAFVVAKSTWNLLGGAKHSFLQVDWDLHRRIRELGKRIYLIESWYIYHWFSLDKNLSRKL